MILWCLTFCWKYYECAEHGGSAARRFHAPARRLHSLQSQSIFILCLNCQMHHRYYLTQIFCTPQWHEYNDSFTFALNICKACLGGGDICLNSKLILHILSGSPCIHAIKSSIFKLNVSFNCVVNIYQKEGDCKCNQALSGFWWCWRQNWRTIGFSKCLIVDH